MDLDAALPWLALRLTPGLGARLTAKLLRQFGSPEEVFRASLTELEACRLPAATAQAVVSRSAFRDAEQELAEIRRLGLQPDELVGDGLSQTAAGDIRPAAAFVRAGRRAMAGASRDRHGGDATPDDRTGIK